MLEKGFLTEANLYFQQLREISPFSEDPNFLFQVYRLDRRSGRGYEAKALLNRLIREFNYLPAKLTRLEEQVSEFESESQRLEFQRVSLKDFLEVNTAPDEQRFLLSRLASLETRLGNYSNALEYFEQLDDLSISETVEKAEILFRLGRHEEATILLAPIVGDERLDLIEDGKFESVSRAFCLNAEWAVTQGQRLVWMDYFEEFMDQDLMWMPTPQKLAESRSLAFIKMAEVGVRSRDKDSFERSLRYIDRALGGPALDGQMSRMTVLLLWCSSPKVVSDEQWQAGLAKGELFRFWHAVLAIRALGEESYFASRQLVALACKDAPGCADYLLALARSLGASKVKIFEEWLLSRGLLALRESVAMNLIDAVEGTFDGNDNRSVLSRVAIYQSNEKWEESRKFMEAQLELKPEDSFLQRWLLAKLVETCSKLEDVDAARSYQIQLRELIQTAE